MAPLKNRSTQPSFEQKEALNICLMILKSQSGSKLYCYMGLTSGFDSNTECGLMAECFSPQNLKELKASPYGQHDFNQWATLRQ